jgi:hypothetical protein
MTRRKSRKTKRSKRSRKQKDGVSPARRTSPSRRVSPSRRASPSKLNYRHLRGDNDSPLKEVNLSSHIPSSTYIQPASSSYIRAPRLRIHSPRHLNSFEENDFINKIDYIDDEFDRNNISSVKKAYKNARENYNKKTVFGSKKPTKPFSKIKEMQRVYAGLDYPTTFKF